MTNEELQELTLAEIFQLGNPPFVMETIRSEGDLEVGIKNVGVPFLVKRIKGKYAFLISTSVPEKLMALVMLFYQSTEKWFFSVAKTLPSLFRDMSVNILSDMASASTDPSPNRDLILQLAEAVINAIGNRRALAALETPTLTVTLETPEGDISSVASGIYAVASGDIGLLYASIVVFYGISGNREDERREFFTKAWIRAITPA